MRSGCWGSAGLDINDPRRHVLRALLGRAFSALEILCIIYTGFKWIEPGMDIDIGVGLSEERGGEETGR